METIKEVQARRMQEYRQSYAPRPYHITYERLTPRGISSGEAIVWAATRNQARDLFIRSEYGVQQYTNFEIEEFTSYNFGPIYYLNP